MLSKKKEEWERLESELTASRIARQPEVWKSVQRTIRSNKEALEPFLEKALNREDVRVAFGGVEGLVLETLFAWIDTRVEYETVLGTDYHASLFIALEHDGNTMALAEQIESVPSDHQVLIFSANPQSALIHAAQDEANMLGIVLEDADSIGLLLGAYLSLHMDILDDIQLDEVIHAGKRILDKDYGQLEQFAQETNFGAVRCAGFNIRQKRHGLKEIGSSLKVSFVSPFTSLAYDGPCLNVLYFPDTPSLRQEQETLAGALHKDGQLVFGVLARKEEVRPMEGSLDLELILARNNLYAPFVFFLVFECLAAAKAVSHHISLDNPQGRIVLEQDTWHEKASFREE